jgi:hypothetical protein
MSTDEHRRTPDPQSPAAAESRGPRADMGLLPNTAPRLRAPRAAGVAGLVFTALLVLSEVLIKNPPPNQTDQELLSWFTEVQASNLSLVGLYLVPFAGLAFLWFLAVIRDRIGRHEDQFFATAFLGTGLLFVALLFVGAAIAGSLIAGNRFFGDLEYPGAEAIRATRSISFTLIYVYAARMAGAFVFICNTIALRTGIFSKWVSAVGYVIGLVLVFNFGFFESVTFVFPAWVAFLSIYILVNAPDSAEKDSSEPAASQ